MGEAPSTVLQVALLVFVVLPGIVFQFLRERWRGPVPGEQDLGERVLRAVTASIILDGLYLVVAGPQLVSLIRGQGNRGWDGLAEQPRSAGAVGLLLFVLLPAAAAGALSWWQRRQIPDASYARAPTAWDQMFRERGSCLVRMRLKDGAWVGGWYGSNSYVSSYPQAPEVFLESAWQLNPDGSFARRTKQTAGLLVRGGDIDILELFEPTEDVTT
jgi:hypothetical protein